MQGILQSSKLLAIILHLLIAMMLLRQNISEICYSMLTMIWL